MKIKYYADTDTLYIEFNRDAVSETKDLDDNTLIDVDAEGNLCAITLEHASVRAGVPSFSFEHIPAPENAAQATLPRTSAAR